MITKERTEAKGRTVINLTEEQLLEDLKIENQHYFRKHKKPISRDAWLKNSTLRGNKKQNYQKYFKSFKAFRAKAIDGVTVSPNKDVRDTFDKHSRIYVNTQKKRRLVTSAVARQSLNRKFFETMQSYSKHMNAEIVVLPMRGVSHKDDEFTPDISEYRDLISSTYVFNKNLKAIDMKLSPTQMYPLSGFDRMGQKEHSLIIASPKQSMKVVPVSPRSMPHTLHSTGAMTNPDTYSYMRTGRLAEQDHVVGGLIVETEDDKLFHIRQFQADEQGGFNDLNKYYCGSHVQDSKVKAFILGDYHAGFHDESAVSAFMEISDLVKPEKILFHDVSDFISCSHHADKDIYEQVHRPDNMKTLEQELKVVADQLKRWLDRYTEAELVIVKSNHDEHLERYLKENRWQWDRFNYLCAHELSKYYIYDMDDPLKMWLDRHHGIKERVRWLTRDEDFILEGIQLGYHGDVSSNGSRGSPESFTRALGRSVVGHSHQPSISFGTWTVGTTSVLQRSYNRGSPSSWLHTSCLLYEGGYRTLVTSINGKWRI